LVYKALGGGWQVRRDKRDNDFVPADTRKEMRDRTDWGELLGDEEAAGKECRHILRGPWILSHPFPL
jgi:hypothetical protein